jgi:hypothetical protein
MWIFAGLTGQVGEWMKRNGLGGLWNGGRRSVLLFRGALAVVLVVFLIEAANDLL